MVRRLDESGVDTSHVMVDPQLKTGMGIALCRENDRAILTYLGSVCAVKPEDVTDRFLASAHHLHHGSFFLHTALQSNVPEMFDRARRSGVTISLDTNWDPEESWNSVLADALPRTDIFMPNEQEALLISRKKDLDAAMSQFHAAGVPLVTVKRGAEGALASDGRRKIECRVPRAVGGDGVGAGDSFDAGFLAGWLRGLPLARCLDIACYCGRSVAAAVGSLQGQPTWAAVAEAFPACA
jgi:sugar/nucleoside kinase (ribokinase family)